MKDDIFFLPLFIKEKIYVIGKDELMLVEEKQAPVTTQYIIEDTTEKLIKPEKIAQTINPSPFLILHEENSPLPAPQEELLSNILKAINIPLPQIEKIFVGEFRREYLTGRQFIFVLSSSVPAPFAQMEKNKVRLLSEGTQALISDSLTDLTNDKQKKMALWAELKQHFKM